MANPEVGTIHINASNSPDGSRSVSRFDGEDIGWTPLGRLQPIEETTTETIMANPDELAGTMNKLMLELALAAIDVAEFAESDQTVASSLAHTSSRQHQRMHVKYARRRLIEAQEQLTFACARLHDNEERGNVTSK